MFKACRLSGLSFPRVTIYNGIWCMADHVDQLLCVTLVFFYGLLILCCATLQKVNREFSIGRVPVIRCSSRNHLVAQLCVVNSLLLGLCEVAGIP